LIYLKKGKQEKNVRNQNSSVLLSIYIELTERRQLDLLDIYPCQSSLYIVCIKAKEGQLFSISTIADILISKMDVSKTIRFVREATDRPWGFRLQGLIENKFFLFFYNI
jgi:hypothetical protein